MQNEHPMNSHSVTDPSKLERKLFDAGLVKKTSLAEIYDIKGRTTVQRAWQDVDAVTAVPDVQDPTWWNDKLLSSMRGEFFARVLEDCGRVLDVGCGEGWPSLYLARTIPEVVGLDVSPVHIDLARNTAGLMGLDNVRFEVAHIEGLPFDDQSFDGVCFGGNVFTYGSDPREMLAEIRRVLRPEGTFAFEQWPVDPSRPLYERIGWFIDGGPPILHYIVGSGVFNRSYFIHFKSDSKQGKRLADLAGRMSGELSPEQGQACEEIKREIETGGLGAVEKAIYSGEDRSLAADEFPALLREAGFADIVSWGLPKAGAFAESLKDSGVLSRLRAGDLRPCLRALVKAAPKADSWVHQWMTCRKAGDKN